LSLWPSMMVHTLQIRSADLQSVQIPVFHARGLDIHSCGIERSGVAFDPGHGRFHIGNHFIHPHNQDDFLGPKIIDATRFPRPSRLTNFPSRVRALVLVIITSAIRPFSLGPGLAQRRAPARRIDDFHTGNLGDPRPKVHVYGGRRAATVDFGPLRDHGNNFFPGLSGAGRVTSVIPLFSSCSMIFLAACSFHFIWWLSIYRPPSWDWPRKISWISLDPSLRPTRTRGHPLSFHSRPPQNSAGLQAD